ncbi:MAG: SDR family oxidoreductase [Caulobacteraceae bacterium]|nr:SDR family oxidoreductase [Caulobacteraceae bacterium]
MGRLAGKRALMTGAAGLMGSDLARAFAREGADLVLTTRTPSKLAPLLEEIRGLGVKAEGVGADFTHGDQIDRLAEQAWSAFGGLDIVVLTSQPTNPGAGDLITTPDETWRELQETIVWGPLRLMRQLAPKMMDSGGGSIVTVISSTGLNPTPGFDAYGMAKGALWLMTRYMAKEWGKGGVRANAFNPGSIITGDNEAALMETAKRTGVLDRISLGRLGWTRECVSAAIYLASDEASFTSGQLINIDGGRF